MVACLMFSISCNAVSAEFSRGGGDKVACMYRIQYEIYKVDCIRGGDRPHVCTCPKENKPFCSTLTILTPKLIGDVLKYLCVEEFRRIMRDIFRKKHKFCKESTKRK